MTRDELVRELERLYAEIENPALFAGSLISYAAHVVRSCGGTCDMWMHATKGAFETAVKTWDERPTAASRNATLSARRMQ